MCTAITYITKDSYFGRNLDLEYGYNETVTVTPRRYPFQFRNGKVLADHLALIGIATVANNYPLYYEATNENGLSMAGLNFPKLAVYHDYAVNKNNITPFELIPWILGQCTTVKEACNLLSDLSLWNKSFSNDYPLTPLHWLLADKNESVTVEPLAQGLCIHKNPVGVLTNSPAFDFQMYNLASYINLSNQQPINRFSESITLQPYSLGMGSIGLPGDPSSPSRFVRAAFTKLNSVCKNTEDESITQFFQILNSVTQQKGVTRTDTGMYEYTRYSSCCNTANGIFYYTTYENRQISAVNMHRCNLDSTEIITFPLLTGQRINFQN